jgi:hypothetical protein
MIFNKKYTPRNEELKRMFSKFRAEHYSMYDTYFKNKWILRKWFKEHYNNYKPTLDQIKNFDVSSLKSSSEAANLAELKHSTPYSKEVRINIYKMYYLIFNI